MTIYIHKNTFLDAEIKLPPAKIEGYFTLSAIGPDGKIRRAVDVPFHNLITDLGMDRIRQFGKNSVYGYLHLGTGTTPPAFTDVALVAPVAQAPIFTQTTQVTNSGSPDYFTTRSVIWTSTIGYYGAVVLTEIGVGSDLANQLFSRELIRDNFGNPTGFPLLADEQIQVTYSLRMYPPLGDNPVTVNISSTSYDTVTRAIGVTNTDFWGFGQLNGPSAEWQMFSTGGGMTSFAYSGGLAGITATNPLGSSLGSTNVGISGYSSGTYYQDTSSTFPISQANGSVKTFLVGLLGARFQVEYTPAIVKTSSQILTLNQRFSWARR